MINYVRIAIGGALLAVGMCVGSLWGASEVSDLKAKHAEQNALQGELMRSKQQELDAERERNIQRIAAIDKEQTEQLRIEHAEINRLRTCIANGTCGLRIVGAKCPAATGVPQTGARAGVGTGAGPTVDAVVGQNYFALREAIAATERKLTACQRILSGK